MRLTFPLPHRLLLAALLAASLAACSYIEAPPQARGAHVDADQLKELVPGTSTRADVTTVLGAPTAHATFDDNKWIYIGETTRQRVGRVQGVEAQHVIVLTFDDNGVLRDIRKLNEKDSRPVQMVTRATPSPGSESSFMQQLLGNVGRYSPGAALGGLGSSQTLGAGGP